MAIWKTLFWKELHEHKWKMLSLIAMVLSVIVLQLIRSDVETGLVLVVYGYILAAPIYITMGVSSAEQANRSISFVKAIPNSIWQAGVARVIVGWLVLMAPLVSACAVCQLHLLFSPEATKQYSGMRQSMQLESAHNAVWFMTAIIVVMASNLYAWLLLTTLNQKSELRSGLIGLVTVVALFLSGILSVNRWQFNGHAPEFNFAWLVMSISPMASPVCVTPSLHKNPGPLWPILVVQLLTIGALLVTAARRYGGRTLFRLPELGGGRNPDHRANLPLSQPFTSPHKALLWMQLRESIPIALCGFVLVLLLAGLQQEGRRFGVIHDFGTLIGCVLALILAVGSYVPHLEPKLHTFWRSRPIPPSQWFWMKYIGGAAVIVLCYDMPLFVLQIILFSDVHPDLAQQLSFPSTLGFPILLHLFIYSVVVLAACSIRHPIYSGVLGVAAILLILLPPATIVGFPRTLSFIEQWLSVNRDSWGHLLHGTLLLSPFIVGSTWLAEWLIRKDISVSQ